MPLYRVPFSGMYQATSRVNLPRCLSVCKGVLGYFGSPKYDEWLDSG